MISIKVYNTDGIPSTLELTPGTSIDMENLLPSFDDKLDGAEFSLPFNIPFTNNNRTVLGYPEHFNTNPSGIPEHWRCDVYDDHVLYAQDAKLKLLNHNGRFDHKDGNYNFNISGIKGFFGNICGQNSSLAIGNSNITCKNRYCKNRTQTRNH